MILCNRADLVRIVKDPENGNLETAAAFMGYFREPDSVSRRLPVPPPGGPPSRKSAQDFSPPETDPCHNLAPLPFWRAVRYETKQETPKEASSTETPPAAFSFSELQQQRASLRPVPKTKQWLSPWSVLLPKMALLIKEKRQGHEVDTDAVVKQWSGGVMLSKIPRRYRARWPRRIQVVVDRSRRLTPFWHDQDEVVSRLKRLIGPKCVDEYRLFDGLREPLLLTGKKGGRRPFQPVAGDTTLVLGDGGALSSVSGDARLWEEFALRLLRGGVTPKMLDPSPQYRACAGSSRKWLREGWEKGSLSSPPQGSLCERVKRLLTVISPAVRVEPGLLRKLRSLLPPEWTDAGTEADLWSHPALQSDSSVALTINAERLENLREGFYNLFSNDEKRCVAVLKTIWNWHAGLNPEVRYEELLSIRGEELSAHFPEEKGEAENYMARLAATLYSSPSEEGRPRAQGEMRAWLRRFKDRTLHVPRLWNPGTTLGTEMQKAANHLFEGDEKTETSGKWEVDSEGIPLERERIWKGAQTGSRLTLETVDQSEPESFSKKGSPLGFFKTTRPLFHAVVERNTPASSPHRAEGTLHRVDGKNNLSLSFPTGDQWTLETDRGDLHFEKMTRPGWADEIGRDEFGLWVSFSLGRATQKMRWIPPGEFLMGSPEREEGRLKGEILHPVVLSRGFWLMDTPVTQQLWGEVMEKNPSEFKSDARPVESVSWHECKEFIKRLNSRLDGLDARLPTEAEWEYGCRAGTTTATFKGNLKIQGECNAPLLDTISWYGGNSGVDFDLKNGRDSSGWAGKQFEHTRAGTHPVGLKTVNPWGLHDMLGNVWEWCEDWFGEYEGGRAIDPTGPEEGSDRVIRGGSWFNFARHVRSACRFNLEPESRRLSLGFRFARGQEQEQGGHPGQGRGTRPGQGWQRRERK